MSDMIFEGLVEWDTENHLGVDGEVDTEDDYVSGALASSWVHGMVNGQYQINFTLRSGVTFHDGTPWNAAAAVTNFEQIIGGRANDSSNWARSVFRTPPCPGLTRKPTLSSWPRPIPCHPLYHSGSGQFGDSEIPFPLSIYWYPVVFRLR